MFVLTWLHLGVSTIVLDSAVVIQRERVLVSVIVVGLLAHRVLVVVGVHVISVLVNEAVICTIMHLVLLRDSLVKMMWPLCKVLLLVAIDTHWLAVRRRAIHTHIGLLILEAINIAVVHLEHVTVLLLVFLGLQVVKKGEEYAEGYQRV